MESEKSKTEKPGEKFKTIFGEEMSMEFTVFFIQSTSNSFAYIHFLLTHALTLSSPAVSKDALSLDWPGSFSFFPQLLQKYNF